MARCCPSRRLNRPARVFDDKRAASEAIQGCWKCLLEPSKSMNAVDIGRMLFPLSPSVEALLAHERVRLSQPELVRARALARARKAMRGPATSMPFARVSFHAGAPLAPRREISSATPGARSDSAGWERQGQSCQPRHDRSWLRKTPPSVHPRRSRRLRISSRQRQRRGN
jgi:hypothetical protein